MSHMIEQSVVKGDQKCSSEAGCILSGIPSYKFQPKHAQKTTSSKCILYKSKSEEDRRDRDSGCLLSRMCVCYDIAMTQNSEHAKSFYMYTYPHTTITTHILYEPRLA